MLSTCALVYDVMIKHKKIVMLEVQVLLYMANELFFWVSFLNLQNGQDAMSIEVAITLSIEA